MNHPISVDSETFVIWRSEDRFTKNPDIVKLGSGRLLLVYSDVDSHWSIEDQILTILASDDLGENWFKLSEVWKADLVAGDERLVTPRLSLLSDGRLAVVCDHNDYGYFHEDQPFGNWIWWSEDDGKTWSDPTVMEVPGFEPDRITECSNGQLLIATHLMRGDSQEFALILSGSDDGGETWRVISTVAHDGYYRYCEGALVHLQDGGIACIMRENHSAGFTCRVAFSEDGGTTWSETSCLPFALHRPYGKQLPCSRVLVTGRHVNGPLGTFAWCGDLRKAAGQYMVAGPRVRNDPAIVDGEMIIDNEVQDECRYGLIPPESRFSEVLFEAEVRVEGPQGVPVASLSCGSLKPRTTGHLALMLASDKIWLKGMRTVNSTERSVDLTKTRKITIHHRRGLLKIKIDDQTVAHDCVFRGESHITDFYGLMPERRTQFGQVGRSGKSYWRSVAYSAVNPSIGDFSWTWGASGDLLPDHMQRTHLLELHSNTREQKPAPDCGYSSWIPLADGRILVVDYTNRGDKPGKSHLVGTYLDQRHLDLISIDGP